MRVRLFDLVVLDQIDRRTGCRWLQRFGSIVMVLESHACAYVHRHELLEQQLERVRHTDVVHRFVLIAHPTKRPLLAEQRLVGNRLREHSAFAANRGDEGIRLFEETLR